MSTFKSLDKYPFEERRKLRGVQNAIAELAIEYAVPNIAEIVLRVDRRRGAKTLQRLL